MRSPSRESFMQDIKPGMSLQKSTFKKMLGYDITTPGFADEAIKKLEAVGCSRAREYYTAAKTEYEQEHENMMRSVSEWYAKQKTWKEVSEPRKQQEAEQQRTKSQRLTDKLQLLKRKRELLIEKQSLTVESSER